MPKRIDITNKRFGKLVAQYPTDERMDGSIVWLCECDCGNTHKVSARLLNRKNTRSCGCLEKELLVERNTKHGLAPRGKQTKLYAVWKSMRQRCDNINCKDYRFYGALGITYCEEWNNYEAFEKWAKENGYKHGLTLDRRDGSKNYEPNNCRFITIADQQRNKISNVMAMYKGELNCLSYFAQKYNVPYGRLSARVCDYGWDISDAIELPLHSINPKRRNKK